MTGKQGRFSRRGRWPALGVLLACIALPVMALAQPETTTPEMPALAADDVALVQVDWIGQLRQGGMTMVALGLVSIAGLAFALERLVTVRRQRFCPAGLVDEVLPMLRRRQYGQAMQRCEKTPSILSDIIAFIITHRRNDVRVLSEGAGDLAGREVADQQEKTYPLAVIAALAPLLGLLGTMIGMIESFRLVEVFGDEGGASMLAGSISKALITTAVGLILAIPALMAYHFFRRRIHGNSIALEREVERLINALFLTESPVIDAEQTAAPAAPPAEADVDVEPHPAPTRTERTRAVSAGK
jgi:biopolymer transport protein ExbB